MVVVYGGVFNPPTLAHYKAAEHVIKKLNVERFIFLPVGINYELKDVNDDIHRINMLKILADKLNVELSLKELKTKEYLGTYKILKSMDIDNICFLLGSDNLHYLHKWKNVDKLLSEFKLIVLSRNESVVDVINNSDFLKKYKDSFIIIDDFNYDISSTKYKESFNNKLLIKEVSEYIEENGLYRR